MSVGSLLHDLSSAQELQFLEEYFGRGRVGQFFRTGQCPLAVDTEAIDRLLRTSPLVRGVIIHPECRNWYRHCVDNTGAQF